MHSSLPPPSPICKRKCLLPDDGAEVSPNITPRGSKALGRENLSAIVAAAKAQALAEQVNAEESRRSFARLVIL